MSNVKAFLVGTLLLLTVMACSTHHEVEVKPVEVKPIHITIDVNVRVDRALDDFFEDIDAAATDGETALPAEDE